MNEDIIKRLENLEGIVRLLQDEKDHTHNGYDLSRISIGSLDNICYGSAYLVTPVTITVSAADVWYEVTSGYVQGVVKGALFGGSHYIQVGFNGVYLISFSTSLQTNTVNQEVACGIMINGAIDTNSHAHGTIVSANKSISQSGKVIVELSSKDQVSVGVTNHSGATDITVEHGQIVLTRIY